MGRRSLEDVNPIDRDKSIAEGKADGTDEDDDGKLAERVPVIVLFFVRMGFCFGDVCVAYLMEHLRHEMINQRSDDEVDKAENDQSINVEGIGAEAGNDGADGKAGVAADGKASHSLAF